jgi:sugar lactone lactonase YvrE
MPDTFPNPRTAAHFFGMVRSFLIARLCSAGAAWIHPLPAQSPPVRSATLLWQVDGSETGEPFGDLRDFVLLKDGAVWALDFKDQVIRRYDSGGKALPVIGRKGSGPGEMRNANGRAVAPDGSVWVNDPSNGRFTAFAASGAYQRAITLPIGGFGYRWGAWFEPSGELVDLEYGQTSRYRRVSRDGSVLGTVASAHCASSAVGPLSFRAETKGVRGTTSSYPFTSGGGVVADRRGHFWCAAPQGSRVVPLPYGKTDTVARTAIDIPQIAVSREERDEAIRAIETRIATYATNNFDRAKIPATKSEMAALWVDDDGRLWVVHAAAWKGTSTTYSVFDGTGKPLFRVSIPARASTYLPVLARGNEFVVATKDADDVVSLARYRLR